MEAATVSTPTPDGTGKAGALLGAGRKTLLRSSAGAHLKEPSVKGRGEE